MEEKILLTEDFERHGYGSYVTNLPNIWSVAYYFEVPNGLIYKTDSSRPLKLKISAYEKFTGINTAQDFTVTASNNVAIVRNPKSNQIEYEWMAIARGRTSGKITYLASYDPSTKQMTFSAIPGGTTEDIDVFYLIADGMMRLQITAPARAQTITQSVFEASLEAVNSTRQNTINQLLKIPADFELRAGWKLEIAVNTPATIILDARDISDGNFTTNWNELAIVSIPVYVGKEV